jgi:hypothetical protein
VHALPCDALHEAVPVQQHDEWESQNTSGDTVQQAWLAGAHTFPPWPQFEQFPLVQSLLF